MGTKTILFCGNGLSAEAIPRVKALGYNVWVITDFPNDRGLDSADAVRVCVTKDPTEAMAAADSIINQAGRPDGVLSLCWDCAISVALIADKYKLLGVSVQTAQKATLKSLRSRAFAEASVPSPRFFHVSRYDQLHPAAASLGFPLVIKPIELSSSKGVRLVESPDELDEAFEAACLLSRFREVILNEYLEGTEHSTEGLMIGGVFHPTALSDRDFLYRDARPYFVEIGDSMPSILTDDEQLKMFKITESAALSVGITDGVAKADLIRLRDGSIKVLEVAARLGGPRFGTEMVPLSNGTDILKAAIQQAVGDPIDFDALRPKYSKGMVNRSLFPRPGIIRAIRGIDAARQLPGFYDFKWWTPDPPRVGDRIEDHKHLCGNVGYIIAQGTTRHDAVKNADRIEQTIVVETE